MRPAASLATVISAVCAAAVLAGCGTPSAAPSTSPPATSATASAPPSAATSPPVTVPAGWKTFTTSDGTLAFDYPEAWTIVDPAGTACRRRCVCGPGE